MTETPDYGRYHDEWIVAADALRRGDQRSAVLALFPPAEDADAFLRVRVLLTCGALMTGAAIRDQFGDELKGKTGDGFFGFALLDGPPDAALPPRVVRPEAAGSTGFAAQLLIAGANVFDSGDDSAVHQLVDARCRIDATPAEQELAMAAVLDLLTSYVSLTGPAAQEARRG